MTVAVWDLKSQFEEYKKKQTFDCMIAEFLLSNGHAVLAKEATLLQYGVSSLSELAKKQQERFLALPKLFKLFKDIEMPLIEVLFRMQQEGILLDVDTLHHVRDQIDGEIISLKQLLNKDIGSEYNLNSSVQMGNFLAEKIGVPLAKTKTGRYATNENELIQFANDFPFIRSFLAYRELTKLRSTYIDSLIEKVDKNSRVHTTYNQIAVSTGRLSSSHPNLQNIPVTSEFGQKIKSCFTAPPGRQLISFDYSQQELRILAHLSQEEKLIEAFRKNEDIHALTASKLFNVDYENVTKQQRMAGKTINFGMIYGMSSFGMSTQLHIPVEQAQLFIHTFYATYPKIHSYYQEYLAKARINRYVETLFGRRRYVFEHPKQTFIDGGMRRVLMNYPIQGTAADLIKKAMLDIENEVLRKDSSTKLLLQIHDDLVFEIEDTKEKIQSTAEVIRKSMCEVYPLTVPVVVDVKIGKTWGNMKNIY